MAQLLAGAEGFDIYPAGSLANAGYPWTVLNAGLPPSINTTAGNYGGGALYLPCSSFGSAVFTPGAAYSFLSSMQPLRGNVAGNGSGAFALNMWLNVTSMNTGSGTLLGLGSSQSPGVVYPLLNISQSATSGLSLQFVRNVNSPTSTPFNYAIALNTYYWLSISFAFYSPTSTPSSALMYTSVWVNNQQVLVDAPVVWSSDLFAAGMVANQLVFHGSNLLGYFVDDLVMQATSGQDTAWPLAPGQFPTPETIPNMTARHIQLVPVTGNGSLTQMTPSGAQPNWQSATDPTGANYVTANNSGLTDLYKLNAPAMSDVRAMQIRGASNRYQNVQGAYSMVQAGSAFSTMPVTSSNPSEFISWSEQDNNGNAWTPATINAGQFGITSR